MTVRGTPTFSSCLYVPPSLDSSSVAVLWPQSELLFSVGSAVFQDRFSDGSAS